MTELTWGHDGLGLTFTTDPHAPMSLTGARTGAVALAPTEPVGVVQILTAGSGHALASTRVGMTALGERLRYAAHEAWTAGSWHHLRLTVEADGLRGEVSLDSPDGVAAFASTVTVTNTGDSPLCLRSVSSWAAPLGVRDPQTWAFHSAASDWLAESRWSARRFRPDLFPGIAAHLTGVRPRGSAALVSHGTWSSGQHTPVAAAASAVDGAAWLWQVEHNGPWRIEVGEEFHDFSVALSGPTDLDHAWSMTLAPGEAFTTVPAAVALGATLDDAAAAMTRYRRAARRPHPDNALLPVCFNDYMNTLNGDPTTATLLPLIDAAAEVGAEVFCVDAGWYDDSGHWWDSVGEWQPSTTRFPTSRTTPAMVRPRPPRRLSGSARRGVASAVMGPLCQGPAERRFQRYPQAASRLMIARAQGPKLLVPPGTHRHDPGVHPDPHLRERRAAAGSARSHRHPHGTSGSVPGLQPVSG